MISVKNGNFFTYLKIPFYWFFFIIYNIFAFLLKILDYVDIAINWLFEKIFALILWIYRIIFKSKVFIINLLVKIFGGLTSFFSYKSDESDVMPYDE